MKIHPLFPLCSAFVLFCGASIAPGQAQAADNWQAKRAAYVACLADYIGAHGAAIGATDATLEALALCRPQEESLRAAIAAAGGPDERAVTIARQEGQDIGLRRVAESRVAVKRTRP